VDVSAEYIQEVKTGNGKADGATVPPWTLLLNIVHYRSSQSFGFRSEGMLILESNQLVQVSILASGLLCGNNRL
jgi:hypothetical protein